MCKPERRLPSARATASGLRLRLPVDARAELEAASGAQAPACCAVIASKAYAGSAPSLTDEEGARGPPRAEAVSVPSHGAISHYGVVSTVKLTSSMTTYPG